MDHFIFRAIVTNPSDLLTLPDIPGESLRMVWGSDGASINLDDLLADHHIPGGDQFIPGGDQFDNPLLG